MVNMKYNILLISLFLFTSFVYAQSSYADCSVYGNCPSSVGISNINNSYTTINNTYINQTVNVTVNTTQFTSANPITISINWLSSLYCKLTGCTMTGNINMNGYNVTNSGNLLTNLSDSLNDSITYVVGSTGYINMTTLDARYMSGGSRIYWVTNQTNPNGYRNLSITLNQSSPLATTTTRIGTSRVSLGTWISPAHVGNLINPAGVRTITLTARVADANRIVNLQTQIYLCNYNLTSNTCITITPFYNSSNSEVLSTTDSEYKMSYYHPLVVLNESTRFLVNVTALKTSGLGTDVILTFDDNSYSRFEVPSPVGITDLTGLARLDGANFTGNITAPNMCYSNGTNCVGGSQTPWTSDINAGAYNLTNLMAIYDNNGVVTIDLTSPNRVFYDASGSEKMRFGQSGAQIQFTDLVGTGGLVYANTGGQLSLNTETWFNAAQNTIGLNGFNNDAGFVTSGGLDAAYLKLDQTTPQTVTGGQPIFEGGISLISDNSLMIYSGTGTEISFYTNTAESMTIYGSGNVGIGTSGSGDDGVNKLQVNGNGRFMTQTTDGFVKFTNGDGTLGVDTNTYISSIDPLTLDAFSRIVKINGDVTYSGTLQISDTAATPASLSFDGGSWNHDYGWRPTQDNVYNLGDPSYRYANGYFGGTVLIGTTTDNTLDKLQVAGSIASLGSYPRFKMASDSSTGLVSGMVFDVANGGIADWGVNNGQAGADISNEDTSLAGPLFRMDIRPGVNTWALLNYQIGDHTQIDGMLEYTFDTFDFSIGKLKVNGANPSYTYMHLYGDFNIDTGTIVDTDNQLTSINTNTRILYASDGTTPSIDFSTTSPKISQQTTDGFATYTGSDGTLGTQAYGLTDSTSYWMCTASDCSTSCQVTLTNGLVTGCS